nr:unnamed protein product [Callosobruchus chinensis]
MCENINFKHSSRIAWGMLCKLGGTANKPRQRPGISANQISNHIAETSRVACDKEHTIKIKRELKSLRARCPNDSNLSAPFTLSELDEALKQTKHVNAPGLDNIHPEFLIHLGNTARKWLLHFFSGILDGGLMPSELKRTI